jgi:membrane-associated phospholipid phosphatase
MIQNSHSGQMAVNSETGNGLFLARLISAVFHPFLMAPVTFALIIFGLEPSTALAWKCFLAAVAVTTLIPFILITILKMQGKVGSIDIPHRQRRFGPFTLSVVTYLIALYILYKLGATPSVLVIMWIYAFNTAVATLITLFWKISIHGMAIGGPVAGLGYLLSVGFYGMLLLLPLILFARVKLKAHTPLQVLSGFGLGFILTLLNLKVLLP